RMNLPSCRSAHSILCSPVRILPTWSRPVGEGAKRVTTDMGRLYARGGRPATLLPSPRASVRGNQPFARGNAPMKLMTGNSNLPLAQAIAQYLEIRLTEASVRRFADEEIFVEINEN